jgi:hypothetical protein
MDISTDTLEAIPEDVQTWSLEDKLQILRRNGSPQICRHPPGGVYRPHLNAYKPSKISTGWLPLEPQLTEYLKHGSSHFLEK